MSLTGSMKDGNGRAILCEVHNIGCPWLAIAAHILAPADFTSLWTIGLLARTTFPAYWLWPWCGTCVIRNHLPCKLPIVFSYL